MASISVVITVYNTAKYLDQCMESVLGQTFKDFEVLLVDDGSTDGVSPALCDSYGERDQRVRVIHKENGGLTSAWIAGVTDAKTDIICLIDSDDWVDTDMLEELYKHYDGSFTGGQIVSSNYIVEKASERRKETQGLKPGVYMGADLEEVKKNLMGNEVRPVTMSRCMKLISRNLILDNIKYCDPSIIMGEDVNITLPCLCDCKRLVIMEGGYFYHYRMVFDSMSHGYNPKLLANLERSDKTFREILKDKNIINADHQMDREFVVMLLVVLRSELRCPQNDTVQRVRNVFLRTDIRKKLTDTKVTIPGKAGKLLYFCAKHPIAPIILFTRFVITSYDKRTN
ncbi:MAG: glycosyltransferase [Butyrivibrio sp.]|nr:glycosyltransferase [Butyrivibrio sp.]